MQQYFIQENEFENVVCKLASILSLPQCVTMPLFVGLRFVPSQWETSLQSNAVSHWLGANLESGADSRFAPSQWETSLQSNAVSHWLGTNLESALCLYRYNEVLVSGLPDWRQPVFYYRRVRKLGLLELFGLLTIILTVGHGLVIWAIYLEKRFEMVSDNSRA